MSIIIRLQNLPLSAKSGDIRRFFGGLRIPNGGVHIVGGKEGDAFIAFTTDEDARLAMRKDGGKILDTRIKLYLSSRVEMQQEIGRITKEEESEASRQLSPIGRQISIRGPLEERELDYGGRSYRANSPGRRGQSPFTRGSRSPGARSRSPRRRSRSPRRRSRSPRKRSRSPMMSSGSRRSRSPIKRTFMAPAGQRSTSPQRSDADSSIFSHDKDMGSHRDGKLVDIEMLFGLAKGSSNWKSQDFVRGEENALLEQKIAEALSASLSSIGKMYHNPRVNEPLINIQGERIGEPAVSMHGGRIEEPANMHGGRIGEPAVNMHGGRIGDPAVNMHGGRFVEPELNIQGGRVGEPIIHMQGGRVSDLGINMQSVKQGEQFPNLNPNLMSFQPEYISSGLREMMPVQENNRLVLPNMPPSSNINMLTNFNPAVQPLQYPPPMSMPPMVNLPPPMPISTMPPPLAMPPPMSVATMPPTNVNPNTPNVMNPNIPLKGYFVTLSGLNPLWNINDIQNMLKGIFVPSKNIKWEVDDRWAKTGTAFLKLDNKEDFMQLLSSQTYSYNDRIISVSECPDFVFHKYFPPELPSESSLNSSKGEFYHKITGLPYEANYDNVLGFFDGLEVTDLYIIYSKSSQGFRIQGKATGIAFIAFGNSGDSSKAMSKNGQRFAHSKRVVNITNSSKRSMLEAKQKNNDLLSQSTTFVRIESPLPKDGGGSFQMHPLCTLLTGLPQNVSKGKIINFMKKNKAAPGLIHITLNDKQKPNGRAFVEFNSYEDFDRARQLNGKKIGDHTIYVKQVLYEEMAKCLESQQRNSFENIPQNPLKPYSHLSTEVFQNQSNPGKNSPIQENYRPTYNDREYNSGRNIIQVFEYGNKSSEPIPVPNTTSNLDRQKPLKPCIKNSQYSYREDHNSDPPFELPFKKEPTLPIESKKPESFFSNVLQKSNQSASSREFKKPESSFSNVIPKSNQSAHSEESKKPESFSNVVQKSNQSASSGEFKKPESTFSNVVPKSIQSTHSGESKKPESSLKPNPMEHEGKPTTPDIIIKKEVKEPDQSTHSKVSNETEIEEEAIKMEMEEEARIPVKFEVKIKPAITKSNKVEDAFDNADPKKKLSKLSPERIVAVSAELPAVVDSKTNDEKVETKKTEDDKNVGGKSSDKKVETKKTEDDRNVETKDTDNDKSEKIKSIDVDKNVKTKSADDDKTPKTEADKIAKAKTSDGGKNIKSHEAISKSKTKSPEKDIKKNEKAKSSEFRSSTRRDSRDSKNYRSRNHSRDRSGSRKYGEDRRRSPIRSNPRKRPISRSPPRRSDYHNEDAYPHHSKPDPMAVVQICNVDPLIGSAELLNFFRGFRVDADKIIRRIDDWGQPTGDVRVTFRNHRVAEVAIRNLNGSYLNGLPVSMFHVD